VKTAARLGPLRLAPLLGAAWLSQAALADEFLPRAALSVIYSDNINRQAASYGSDTVVTAQAGFHYLHESQRWHANVGAMASYSEFLQNTYDPRTLGSGSLLAGLIIVPRYVTWELQDNYGQIATDSFGAIEPTDRQNTNYLSTGPNFSIPLGRSRIDLQARYSDVTYQDTDTLNNERTSFTGALVHPWTDIRTLSVNLFQSTTRFDHSELFRSYDLRSVFASLQSSPRRSVYQFDLGATEVDDGIRVSRGTLVGVSYAHQIGVTSAVQLYARRGFADSADTFRFESGGSTDPLLIDQNVQVRADPYQETRVDAAFISTRARGAYSIMPYMVDEKYVNNPLFDRRRGGLRADASYSFGGTWRLDGYVSGEDNTYANPMFDHRDYAGGFGVTRWISNSIQAIARFEHFDRSSDVDSYKENRLMLLVQYAPVSRARVNVIDPNGMLNRARGTNSQPTTLPPTGGQ